MSRTPTPPISPSPFIPRGTTRSLNMVRSQLNDLSMMSGQAGHMAVQRGPLGTSFIDTSVDLNGEGGFYGVLVNAGPAGTADFPDARYWVREVSLSQTQGASMTDSVAAYMGASFLNSDGSYGGAKWLVATNLLECMVGTHTMTVLPANTPISAVLPPTACIVWVQKIQAGKFTNLPQDYGNEVYVFEPVTSAGGLASLFVNITGYSGSGPTSWNPYVATFPDASTGNVYQREDLNGIAGTPGSLGANVATDGSTTGGCHVQPAGLGRRRVDWDPTIPGYVFEFQNSAQ